MEAFYLAQAIANFVLILSPEKIILGGGQNLLSPERRFDAIIFNSPELFT